MAHSCASCLCSRQSASTFPSGLKGDEEERTGCGVRRKNRMRGERSGMVSPISALQAFGAVFVLPAATLGVHSYLRV